MAIGFLAAGILGIVIGGSYEQLKNFPVFFVVFYGQGTTLFTIYPTPNEKPSEKQKLFQSLKEKRK
ncbi:hypothetical protein BC937DRAFT_88912 [Endogone sp. FLAS-F59071]|nr:hypothetical protein BC937DRAFT_88912 [Endogone sp. FLAS-F59071]|eukprot:RUS18335.1 hypothetical protein BC937DRAFT_88912 [Endogone sp. FLAS-F59071]